MSNINKRRGIARWISATAAFAVLGGGGLVLAPDSQAVPQSPEIRIQSVKDGTPVFDANDGPGLDTGDSNGIIRTNDTVTYVVNIAPGDVEDPAEVAVTLTLPKGQEFRDVPSWCKSAPGQDTIAVPTPAMGAPATPLTDTSWDNLPVQSLTCYSKGFTGNSSHTLSIPAFQRPEVPNGQLLDSPVASISVKDGEPVQSTEDIRLTVSAKPEWDLGKNGVETQENSIWVHLSYKNCEFDPSQRCARMSYPITISGKDEGKGQSPLVGDVTFTDFTNPSSFYGDDIVNSPAWKAAGADANTKYAPRLVGCKPGYRYGVPGAKIPDGKENDPAEIEKNVRDSGEITCVQTAPGDDISVTLKNTDWSLYSYPSKMAYPVGRQLPDSRAWAFVGTVTIEMPIIAVAELGSGKGEDKVLRVKNVVNDFAGTGIGGVQQDPNFDPQWNNYRTANPTISPGGGFGKAWAGVPGEELNTPRMSYIPGNELVEGPPENQVINSGNIVGSASQDIISWLRVLGANNSNPVSGSAVLCDTWDNSMLHLHVRDVPASSDPEALGQQYGSDGKAVWDSGTKFTEKGVRPQFTVKYGHSDTIGKEASGCRDGKFYDNPADVPGNDPQLADEGVYTGVNQVRIFTQVLPPREDAPTNVEQYFSILLRVANGMEPGTIIPNWAGATFKMGEYFTEEEVLAKEPTLSAYIPETHENFSKGDRLIFAPAYVRINKTIVQEKADGETSEQKQLNATAGDTVTWKLVPKIATASPLAPEPQPVIIEDCLPGAVEYISASVSPEVVSNTTPADATISCDSGTYIRFNLGERLPNTEIAPIIVETAVSEVADEGSYKNYAEIQTTPIDPSTAEQRSSKAQLDIQQISGVHLAKKALTPIVQINAAENEKKELNIWQISARNVKSESEVSDVEIIDVLPTTSGQGGSEYSGTMKFVSAEVVEGTGITISYTANPDVTNDLDDPSNAADGATTWCDGLNGSVIFGDSAGECPQTNADITGIRITRPGVFNSGDKLSVNVSMVAAGNKAGDTYANSIRLKAKGVGFQIGPVTRIEKAVASSIGDYVWKDMNANGLQDDGEAPYEGVTVTLNGTDDRGNTVPTKTVTTDATGAYLFENLRAGTYTVQFNKKDLSPNESFTLKAVGTDRTIDSDGDPVSGKTAEFSLGAGQARMDLDQGVMLERGSVGDFVFDDKDGDGIQDQGEPGVEGVTVVLEGTDEYGEQVMVKTVTDADGAYVFSDVVPGTYTVAFDLSSAPQGYVASPQGAGDDPAKDSDGDPVSGKTAEFSLGAGQARMDLDQGVMLERGSVGDFVFDDKDGDGIQDQGEPGVEGVTVVLEGTDEYGEQVMVNTVTDADGAYVFSDVVPGTYTVAFDLSSTPQGYVASPQGAGDDPAKDSDGDPVSGKTAEFSLGAGQARMDLDQGLRMVKEPEPIPDPAPTPDNPKPPKMPSTGSDSAAITLVSLALLGAGVAARRRRTA